MAYLELIDVQKRFGRSLAVDGFDLAVERGEFISFLGPSGCGKTTTLRMIAGFEMPSAGKIVVEGKEISHTPPNRRNVGMVFQSYALFPNMTVERNIGFGLKVLGRPAAEIRQRVGEMLEMIHLPAYGDRYPWQLSGGQQQRVALARALARRPQVLLLDEPLSALDAKIRLSLRQEIRAIQRMLGITTIYVTHDQEEALSLSDRIVVMNEGRIEQIGRPMEIYNIPRTAFVASFVGTLNVLKAHVVDGDGRLVVDGQEISAPRADPPMMQGTTISVALRPEMISIGDGQKVDNRLTGIVEDVMFLGAVVRVRLRLQEQKINFDLFNSPRLRVPALGQRVTISFPADVCMYLPNTKSETAQAAQKH